MKHLHTVALVALLVFMMLAGIESSEAAVVPYSNYMKNLSLLADPNTGYIHENPKITVSGQYVHILWTGLKNDWTERVIFYIRSTDGGKTFEQPKVLVHGNSGNFSYYFGHSNNFVADGQYLHIFCSYDNQLNYIRSIDNGATFSSPVGLGVGESNIYATASNGKVAVGVGTGKSVLCFHSSDNGATFSKTTVANSPEVYIHEVVDATRSGDNVYFLTRVTDQNWYVTESRLYLYSSGNGGISFNGPVQVTIPTTNGKTYSGPVQVGYNYSPNLFADGATVNVVWLNIDDYDHNALTLRARRSTDGGLTLKNPATLYTFPAGSGAQYGLETIAGKGSSLYISTIIAADTYTWRSLDAGASWSIAKKVMVGRGWSPQIGVDPSNASSVHLTNGWYFQSPDAGGTFTGGVNATLFLGDWLSPSMSVSSGNIVHYCGYATYSANQVYYRRLAPEPAPETINQAVSLSKTDAIGSDNLQIPAFSNVNFSTQMSMEFLIQRNSDIGYFFDPLIRKKRTSGSPSYAITANYANLEIYGTLVTDGMTDTYYGKSMGTGVTLPKNIWTHIAMTYDATLSANNWKIFVNGQLTNQMDVKGSILTETAAAPLAIGNDGSGSLGSMKIDELRLWNRPLSQTEIAANMFKHFTGTENGLTAYYTFNNTFKEITGKGYDAVPMYWEKFVPSNIPPVLSVTPGTRNVVKESGTTTFSVSNSETTSMPWTAAVTSGGTWLTITSGASGTNSGTITCAYTANTAAAARTGTIRVTATGATGSPKDVTVTQAAAPAPVVISGTVKTGNGAAISGVTITFSNSGGTAATDSGGNYSKSVMYGYSGTATPAKSGYTFSPVSRTFTNVTTNQTSQNFTGTPPYSANQQCLAVWSDGVWVWDKTTGKWTLIPSTKDVTMIAAGKVDTDGVDDLIGVWPSGFYLRQSSNGQWIKLSTTFPTWITTGDLNNDGRDDVIATWAGDGAYYRDSATGKWIKVSSPAKQLAAGNIGGIRDDLAGLFSDGLWIRYSVDASWKHIDAWIPLWMTVGDMTGDKRSDIVVSYGTGTWVRNSATGGWVKLASSASQLAAGDMDGDGRDDLVGIWSGSIWVFYPATGQWQEISKSKPGWLATGKVLEAIQAAGSLEDPAEREDILDQSREWSEVNQEDAR